jgi:YidC/Oxa1 family membrane protein insertase
MSLSQFITQRQLMVKNLPKDAAENNPFLQQQKILLYVFPILFAVFGINFPVGVLLYWLVSNTWSMGQQLYVIRRMPSPGSLAHQALEERRQRKAAKRGRASGQPAAGAATSGATAGAGGPGSEGGTPSVDGKPSAGGGTSGKPAAGAAGSATQATTQATHVRRQPQRVSRAKRTQSKKKR